MADRKQKWRHVVTQPRERKSKKNSTKTQQKQNALTKILITNKKWVRCTRLGTTCSDLRPLQRPLFVRRPEEPKVLTLTALPRFLKWGGRVGAGRKWMLLLLRRPATCAGAPHHIIMLELRCDARQRLEIIELSMVTFFLLSASLCTSSLVFHWFWWKCCLGNSPVQLLRHLV